MNISATIQIAVLFFIPILVAPAVLSRARSGSCIPGFSLCKWPCIGGFIGILGRSIDLFPDRQSPLYQVCK